MNDGISPGGKFCIKLTLLQQHIHLILTDCRHQPLLFLPYQHALPRLALLRMCPADIMWPHLFWMSLRGQLLRLQGHWYYTYNMKNEPITTD